MPIQKFQVLIDVKASVHVPVTVNAIDKDAASESARDVALAKFKAEHPDVCGIAYLVETKAVSTNQIT